MNSYKEHPLLEVSRHAQANDAAASASEQTIDGELDPSLQLRRRIGALLYPWKNRLERPRIERQLGRLGVPAEKLSRPDIICAGHKGFGNDIFLQQIPRFVGQLDTVVCFGCGLGGEVALVSRMLRPRKVIGCDFFAHHRAWKQVKKRVESEQPVEVDFVRLDLRNPAAGIRKEADLVVSFAVLEHLRDMDACFAPIQEWLKDGGAFASQWGPMWYSYSGDHIAAELGFSEGYQHLLLSATDYLEFYRSHPRNREAARAGIPTWLDLGLHNFARYDEYMTAIDKWFGPAQFLKWQVSTEALRWAAAYPNRWQEILKAHPHITSLDLVLGGAALVARNITSG